ncbi:UDP-N-acetylgalactosamine-undecaprenyl-phosphate N-acetylgalactosaminephosphotransferase [Marinomonas gallaica]|uniref:UDP-N-acetylgalactosamine-undecaprenyl-phosphate N-acetylgalactosaminephosphotransferase n=1 Tax=Marinomonas gallaica TaxID=1806667 RepID=A0A1C3JMS2_9GAMM|nr:sugar transferase [Marinomonas gallaica]SBT16455.1 UDP-N-acetylgalactosamine-undecaprenyl-phosphate N-acetylgalactosaminephosphotransferase [Marinomonas gallaica]SBT21503.1 UDP-N-acetylgalactosamine-undecaprenyl-phosphate N-acetylgalactosaminephosphotransferase [Marinomonas gallaica]
MPLAASFAKASSSFLFICIYLSLILYRIYCDRQLHKICYSLQVTFKTWFFDVFFLLVLLFFFFANLQFSRVIVSLWVVITPFFVMFTKMMIQRYSRSFAQAKIQVAVLGRHYEFNALEHEVLEIQGVELTYFSLEDNQDIEKTMLSMSPDYLLLNLETPATNQLIKELTHLDLKGIRLIVLHHFMESFLRKCYIPYDGEDLSYLEKVRSYSLKNYLLKRTIDWLAVFSISLCCFPIIIYTVTAVRRQSPGNVLFRQCRVGKSGENFVALKFRSMHEGAHFDPYTQKEDPRIFPFGSVMRKFRIDELPQLWNVMKGEMHLVGPRTEWNILVENYERGIPYYNERHIVRPGISGWAQVCYPYGTNLEDARQKLMYDLYYIKHWSVWLELETLLRTVVVVLSRKGL